MTRDEIVTALRCCASPEVDCKGNCAFFGASSPNEDCSQKKNTAATDLIENQQNHIAALMKANDSLKDAIARRDKQIEDMKQGMAQLAKAVAVKEEQRELHTMKNELCQHCGKYKQAHEGACDGCRWRDM
nr:MAG TPA: zinc finger protein [Caudoviricetes sp.]